MSQLERAKPPATMPTDLTTEAVLDLYGQFVEVVRALASSNDIVRLLDDWFVDQGFPSTLRRT
jgi:hypothetical protein